jgi:uncharacterized protein YdaU (DUF1376 family)
MAEKSPAFQFYPQDYLADPNVAEMTLEEQGAYIRLICYAWIAGSIPADPERCARLVGNGCSIAVATNVQRAFNEPSTDPQRLLHKRVEKERQKQAIRREQTSLAGRKSAEKRSVSREASTGLNKRSTNVQRKVNPSSSSSDEDGCVADLQSQAGQFEQFWSTCPRKTAKGSARKAWIKAIKLAPPETIIQAMAVYAKSTAGKDPQYIAHPATWLNGERWLDDSGSQLKKRDPFPFDLSDPVSKAKLEQMFLDGLHT